MITPSHAENENKLNLYKNVIQRMFTREISSPDETRPGIKSSLSFHGQMCLHVFAEMKYHPGMNSSLSKRPCKHFIWGEILK